MPVQVVTIYTKIPPPPINLETAGVDQFPFCDTVITLSAIVDPVENIGGHTILWEQIEGTNVVLSAVDELTVSYTQIINDFTDKKFKITLDLGEIFEQVDELVVYATPTTPITTGLLYNTVAGAPARPVENMAASTVAAFDEPQGVINADVVVTPEFNIIWDLPSDATISVFLQTMNVYENGILVGTYIPTDTLSHLGTNTVYQIESVFIVNQQPSSTVNVALDFTNTAIPATNALDDKVDGIGFASPQFELINYPNVVKSYSDTFTTPAFVISDTEINKFINIQEVGEDSLSNIFATSLITITRTDPGGIGGG